MGKIIVFYNHKGGVGKTTLVHNLSFALADAGKKVLTIDADPQMNLTAAIYGLSTAMEYSLDEDSKWRNHINRYISLDEYVNGYLKKGGLIEKEVFRKSGHNGNGYVDLISGSINLTKIETELYEIIRNRNSFTEEIPYNFERSVAEKTKEYDFVLIDTPPSAGSIINGLYIMSCDYFITPVSPTFFSLQAIDNLSFVMKNWMNLLLDYQSTKGEKGLSCTPKFLGIAVQMAKRFTSGGVSGGYSKSAKRWIGNVNESVKRFLEFASIRTMAVSAEEFQRIFPEKTPFVIETCCDFTPKLRDISENEGVPVIHLTQEICSKHDKKVSIVSDRSQYCKSFNSISKSYKQMADNFENLE